MSTGVENLEAIDAVVVGGGFSGIYMLHLLRKHGFSVRLLEAGSELGGTWYWNQYPGARCDVESLQYSYSFSEELQKEWHWSERYASQKEIQSYLNYVADKFDLRKDICLNTLVTSATFDESATAWKVETKNGNGLTAKFCIMATGVFTEPNIPDIKGLDSFKGKYYHTSRWPKEVVSFSGRRIAVVGTGATGIQCIPLIAEEADHVFVFQRTPNFIVPSRNEPMTKEYEDWWKMNYPELRRRMQNSRFGFVDDDISDRSALSVSDEERLKEYETRWKVGGSSFLLTFNDLLVSKAANDTARDFIQNKIRTIIKDPQVAEALLPYNHYLGAKRLCVENHYYEAFNRDNVTLVDIRHGGIDEITNTGLRVKDKLYDVDDIVFATGFHAITGALLKIDIFGRSHKLLREKWSNGTHNYLGFMTADFPNLFIIAGPGSPSILTHMIPLIEQQVEWIADCISYLRKRSFGTIEPTVEAESQWGDHINELAVGSLASTRESFYTGAKTGGKRLFFFYTAGTNLYRKECNDNTLNNYEGFLFK